MKNLNLNTDKTKSLTLCALMLALAISLSFLESLIPQTPFMPPGIKIGLSNVVVMFSVFYFKKSFVFLIILLKSLFVFVTKGIVAFILSFSGGLISAVFMIFLFVYFKKISYSFISVCGAVMHSTTQIVIAVLILNNFYLFYYLPIVLFFSIIMGVLTAFILKFTYLPLTKILK